MVKRILKSGCRCQMNAFSPLNRRVSHQRDSASSGHATIVGFQIPRPRDCAICGPMVHVCGMYMLRTKSQTQHPCRDSTENWKLLQELERPRETTQRCSPVQGPSDKALVREYLEALRHLCRKFAALSDLLKLFVRDRSSQYRLTENVRSRYCVLNGKIDADAPDRRHRVRRISDT